ncbi:MULTISPECIES: hypothetical protein [unclassified Bradyrhizobium]|uniref:hypothetical protein n=1 Tax=unclassified Bradyrhizobium TaxID=2631580 RepID=UPI00201104F0|nr:MULTISPECIES: hypothetical protein [unclassified Bradyrhizobium]
MRLYRRSLRIVPLIVAVLSVAIDSVPASADMSKDTSTSAGSFFAAALLCEGHDRIPQGQTKQLMKDLEPYLSPRNKSWMQEGFERGLKDQSVFIPKSGWVKLTSDEAECYRVQGVLDDYRSQINE